MFQLNNFKGLGIVAATAGLMAGCGQEQEMLRDLPTVKPTPVAVVPINGDTDATLDQFSFVDADGVKQKCFVFSGRRGSVSCQPDDTEVNLSD